jgi:hypothetical protein
MESKEHMAGYLVIEAQSIERAVEIAERSPDGQHGAMEVRPIIDTAGMEM